ncbi:hypothetical protein IKQ26_02635 [bacterium]|nr:hypothetical protein [bacterium]
MIPPVSFSARRVFVSPNKKVGDATASELAQTINSAYNVASKQLNDKDLKPLFPVSGKTMIEKNPYCFDKNKKLTEAGKDAFNIVNEALGVSTDSTMGQYSKAIQNYIAKYYDLGYEKNVCRMFDVLI